MTRCKHCGYSFAQENGWQDYCSQECAMLHFAGMIIPCGITINDSVNRKLRHAVKCWHEFLSDERNLKLVRWGGERAKPPQVGRYEQRFYKQKDKDGTWHTYPVLVNVGGEIKARPMTEDERSNAYRYRGRGSFGENMVENQVWRDLPSVHGLVGQGWFPHD